MNIVIVVSTVLSTSLWSHIYKIQNPVDDLFNMIKKIPLEKDFFLFYVCVLLFFHINSNIYNYVYLISVFLPKHCRAIQIVVTPPPPTTSVKKKNSWY